MNIFYEIAHLLNALYDRLLRIIVHYWISFSTAFLLEAAALWIAYVERGYRAFGSEYFVFPIALYIGMTHTKPIRQRNSRNGTRKDAHHDRVCRNQRPA